MKVGLQICSFTWPGGDAAIGPTLARIARVGGRRRLRQPLGHGPLLPDPRRRQARGADARGHDHARLHGGEHDPRPAGADGRRRPLPRPGAVDQVDDDPRRPERRARLAGHRGRLERGGVARPGLRLPAPRRPLRAPRGHAPDGPRHVAGRARQRGGAARPAHDGHAACSTRPQSISRPRVPIMVGGGGEKKTLRLVAQYADACNVFGSPEAIARKYAILDAHCATVGRDPAEIERSTLQNIRLSPAGDARTESPAQVVDRLRPSSTTPAPSTSSSSSRTSSSRAPWRPSAGTSCRPSTPCPD